MNYKNMTNADLLDASRAATNEELKMYEAGVHHPVRGSKKRLDLRIGGMKHDLAAIKREMSKRGLSS